MAMLLALLMLWTGASAESWLDSSAAPDAPEHVTEKTVYDAADSVGTVVNAADPGTPDQMDMVVYSFTPLDVILVVDVSGSMEDSDGIRTLLDYAKMAAEAFSRTLIAINPASRIGVVAFSSSAFLASSLCGLNEQDALLSAIGSLMPGGSTNTGGGFALAAQTLTGQAMPGRRCMTLMITDGLANEGTGDPVRYATQEGTHCGSLGTVYTIGLVGTMDASGKRLTRQVLNAGYEARYFEVDSGSVGDAGTMLNMLTTSIAMAASTAETIGEDGSITESTSYMLSVSEGYDARVTGSAGGCLSSFAGDYSESAALGTMVAVNGKKQFVMLEGDYTIDVQGSGYAQGGYELYSTRGASMAQTSLAAQGGWSYPCVGSQMVLQGGSVQVTDTGYPILDPRATDGSGNPVQGMFTVTDAVVRSSATVHTAANTKSSKITQLKKGAHVTVLANDAPSGTTLVCFSDENGRLCRGWVATKVLDQVQGYVPEMVWLEGEYTLSADTLPYLAPDISAGTGAAVAAGTQVTLLHAERDESDREWAYVAIPGKKGAVTNAYIPADQLTGWQAVAPSGFRMNRVLESSCTQLEFPEIPIAPGQKLKVYSGPGTKTWRGASGKALVNTNGGLNAFGWVDNNWLLVAYGKSKGGWRVGYIQATDFRGEVPACPVISFDRRSATLTENAVLTDDPFDFTEAIATLSQGTAVTWLCRYVNPSGDELAYIESKIGSKVVRGFVPLDSIVLD